MSKELSLMCSVCGQANQSTNRYCSYCGTSLNASQQVMDSDEYEMPRDSPPLGVPFSGEEDALPRLTDHPAWGAIPVLGLLTILFLGLFIWGIALDANDWPYASLLVFFVLLLTSLILWAQLWSHLSQARNFILSQRPLIGWRYRPEEWEIVRQERLQESAADMKEMAGCAVPFFAGLGTLIGTVISSVEGLAGAIPGAVIGAVGGYLFGKILIPLATGLNQSRDRKLYQADRSVWVVLAPGEVYYNGQYFKSDTMADRIESITLETGYLTWLRIATYTPRGSIMSGFDGNIFVPPRMLETVQSLLPQLQHSCTRET